MVRQAVECVIQREYDAARSALGSIDYALLLSKRLAGLRNRRVRLTHEKIWQRYRQSEKKAWRTVRIECRTAVPLSTTVAIFERDHFLCRYSHCRRRTIYVPVLRALSALFPDIMPYQKNWRPRKEHVLYWTYAASLEHKISFPHGGTSNLENLITACYQCNDIKNMIRASDLGWEVTEIETDGWDGLSSYVPALKEVVASHAVARSR